ncbi:hypothetical protein Kpho02_77530 [Kitasatospora phosalacinea]|uniref:Uncharacterized protein n=1 Tax=Kitasatospora phosalacinea TaxID=2065 RepID=A0A9W6QIB8_9ACTN|nr:hypothetical protein [Kitasatospora phosalacinea]GLW75456.1 hypothetical protein Kpho02_77530 [Kitasatospora phosalacinea]
MDEMRPRGEMPGAVGWDGVERRRQPDPRARSAVGAGMPAWRDPARMSGALLAAAGAGITVEVLRFLAAHLEVSWH